MPKMPRTRTKEQKEQRKLWDQTPSGKKNHRIRDWKRMGIIDEDLSAVYDYYIKETNCMVCFKPYKNSTDRHLDHDHDTGKIRYICCRNCNVNFLKKNFRVITKPASNNSSGYLNIHYDETHNKWIFEKRINRDRICKTFDTKEEAIKYRDTI